MLIKIGKTGAYINLSNVLSIGTAKDSPYRILREDWAPTAEAPKPTEADYRIAKADTVVFYFPHNSEIAFRKGRELSNEMFDKVVNALDEYALPIDKLGEISEIDFQMPEDLEEAVSEGESVSEEVVDGDK